MNINELKEMSEKLKELGTDLEHLEKLLSVYQQNINNNITWFYALISILLVVLLPSLFFLVKTSVRMGIEKGIKNTEKKVEIIRNEIIEELKSYNHEFTPTIFNGWFSDPEESVKIRKDYFGTVHLNGVLLNGVNKDGTTVFVLPVGYRPSNKISFSVITKTDTSRQISELTIESDGSIKIYGALKQIVLNGVYFVAKKDDSQH